MVMGLRDDGYLEVLMTVMVSPSSRARTYQTSRLPGGLHAGPCLEKPVHYRSQGVHRGGCQPDQWRGDSFVHVPYMLRLSPVRLRSVAI